MAERGVISIPSDPSFGWWVTGIVDGEGCFFASLSFRVKSSQNGNDHNCVNLFAGLQVWMRADDSVTLRKIQKYFGCGRISRKRVTKKRRQKVSGANPALCLRIDNLDDVVEKVMPHFEVFPLQSKKANDYEVWRELVLFVYQNLRGRKGWLRRFPDRVEKVASLCERLKDTRVYKPALAVVGG